MEKTTKKDQIADAALTCFLAAGYSGTSMDEIVRVSGISKGGIYGHFKSKDEIFLYIIQKRFSDWDQELMARVKGVDSTKEALNIFVDFFLEIIVAPLLALTYEFLLYTKDKETLDRVYEYTNRSQENVIVGIIRDGINKRELKAFDPVIAANVFMGIIKGISLQWFTQHNDKKTLERSAKTALHIFFTGISK